jgi:hypothetical protein
MSMAAVGMRVLVLVRGEMNAVGLSEGLRIHDFFGSALAANDSIEGVNSTGMSIHHGKVVRYEHHRESPAAMHFGDEFVEVGLTGGVYSGGRLIQQQQFRLIEEAGANQDTLELPAAESGHGAV